MATAEHRAPKEWARTSDDGDGGADAHDIKSYTVGYVIMLEVVVPVSVFIDRIVSKEQGCAKDMIRNFYALTSTLLNR